MKLEALFLSTHSLANIERPGRRIKKSKTLMMTYNAAKSIPKDQNTLKMVSLSALVLLSTLLKKSCQLGLLKPRDSSQSCAAGSLKEKWRKSQDLSTDLISTGLTMQVVLKFALVSAY